jgi:putative restriction endonuclease
MKAYIGVTDGDWYSQFASSPDLDEVNFWQPSGSTEFRALDPGGVFFFKLHSPRNFIVGGGIFAHFTRLPISLAWRAFEEKNGAKSLSEMRVRVEKYRRGTATDPSSDYTIGCILLEQPFFFPEPLWVPVPEDWKANIVRGKGYDLGQALGARLWMQVRASLAAIRPSVAPPGGVSEPLVAASAPRFGKPVVTLPRLGQGSFRVVVTDAYERRCSITGERVLPVLEAAHIRPYSDGGEHRVDNGLLLRSDVHTLFDGGYLTVTPEHKIEVSRRIKEDWQNGREYYALHGRSIREPLRAYAAPAREFLEWHNEARFLG